MREISRLLFVALFALVLSACASPNRSAHSVNMGRVLPPPDTTTDSGAYEGATDYRIGAQDLLEISVFGVDELKHQARVNSNGLINVPLVGSVMAELSRLADARATMDPAQIAEVDAHYAQAVRQDLY